MHRKYSSNIRYYSGKDEDLREGGVQGYAQQVQPAVYQPATIAPTNSFKILSVVEDDVFVIKSQCCQFEFNILHPENQMLMWHNSTSVFGMLKKDTGAVVFNFPLMEPMLD